VFTPQNRDGRPEARDVVAIGKKISLIGDAAGVVVNPETKKTASAHDLRRAFGSRWARLLMPAELKTLMWRADVSITLTYYAGTNAAATAENLWDALGSDLGSTPTNPAATGLKKPLFSWVS